MFGTNTDRVKGAIRGLDEEVAQRFLAFFSRSPRAANYLVRGVQLSTDLDGAWEPTFPEFEVPVGTEAFGERVTLNLPSAFHLFIRVGDYQGAHAIVQAVPEAFTSPGLRGWKAAVCSFVDRNHAVEWLDQAAQAFSEDTLPPGDPESAHKELAKRGGSWSGINVFLWAKYFRSRARVLQAIREPKRLKELVHEAVEALQGTESGFHSGDVSRFRIIVSTLARLLSDPASLSAERARREYQLETQISGEDEHDDAALTFLQRVAEAFNGFRTDPAVELTRDNLAAAVDALGRLPLIGTEVANAIRPALGASAYRELLGPVRTWVHRTLQSITDEAQLRRVLLRLLQASMPRYAQIRHGPIEYGKDLAVLIEERDRRTLRMYQVKCGEIDKKKWRESRDELEEMFQVPLSKLQLPADPDVREGVLLTNGHANPFVEPVMTAWFEEQNEKFGRVVSFMHLDEVVGWIFREQLINEFKTALSELGIRPITDPGE